MTCAHTGHCAKLLAIMHYMYNQSLVSNFQWFLIVDDDSLVRYTLRLVLIPCHLYISLAIQ